VHFERHHSGIAGGGSGAAKLLVHGLVERARMFSMNDLMRFPSVSRFHFIECGATSGVNGARRGARRAVHRTECCLSENVTPTESDQGRSSRNPCPLDQTVDQHCLRGSTSGMPE